MRFFESRLDKVEELAKRGEYKKAHAELKSLFYDARAMNSELEDLIRQIDFFRKNLEGHISFFEEGLKKQDVRSWEDFDEIVRGLKRNLAAIKGTIMDIARKESEMEKPRGFFRRFFSK